MATVSVLALGNWGTALANHLAAKGIKVLGWSHDAEIVASINATHHNPRYQSATRLSEHLTATTDLKSASNAEVIVVACPSSALDEVLSKLTLSENTIIVSAVKGFVDESLRTPLQFAKTKLPANVGLSVLTGPSFAKDVVVQNPCGVVAASDSEVVARTVADLFSSDRMRVYISDDPMGAEIGGIVKNVIALAVGVSDGSGLGESAKAGLITRGLAEMMRLAKVLGGREQTLAGLAGLGDLAMTATCDTSRNRTVGLRLGKGEKLTHIIETLGSVAEGVRSTPMVVELAERNGVDMPITFEMHKLLKGEVTPAQALKNLVTRPLKKEF